MSAVERLRKRFEEEVANNGNLYHEVDVNRVKTEEFQVKRFLLNNDNDEERAFDALLKALQWKKEFGVHDRTDQYFPKEVWELNGVEVNGRDRNNRVIQWEVFRNQRSFKEAALFARQFVAHNLERVDRAAGEDGFILVMDTNGAGISNIDIDLVRFKLTIIEHYPCGLKQMLVVDLPWLLNSVMKIIVSFMSPQIKELVEYTKKTEMKKYMDEENIPVSLSGKRDKCLFPPDLKPLEDIYESLNFNEKFVDNFYSTYKLKRSKK